MKNEIKNKRILITGGSSGLGRSLVSQFLANNARVVAIGRNSINQHFINPNYLSFSCNHASLDDIKNVIGLLKKEVTEFDILINNAGVLSPPKLQYTINGFEISYQVNFLSHVLFTRLLLKHGLFKSGLIVNVSSPIYTRGKLIADYAIGKSKYGMFQAYSNTKLYMALFSNKLAEEGISSFSFNPGTFSSGIYRLQKKWFHVLYKIAAPFMVSPDNVAKALYFIIKNGSWSNGDIVTKKGRIQHLNRFDTSQKLAFWQMIDDQIKDYLI